MNIQNLIRFKKKFGQNYILYFKKKKNDFCSGLNFFNYVSNDIEYNKNCFCKNKIYLFDNKNFYKNFLYFFFFLKNVININLPFNIIKLFIKKQFKIKKYYFKIIIQFSFIKKFKLTGTLIKVKLFKINIFFPIVKIKIAKILYRKNLYCKFINKKIKLNNLNFTKSAKLYFLIYKIITLLNKNVIYNKI
ncbi:hypothetical protein [Candidatus Carsonella ruddii]|uniref:Uncharacterized protein n=1 Tax=Candidatus Carsonella ruddii PC isolate NHV TaxID=1202540 RepID=J3YQN7_CARRU|nr:hypothetical protein [Candidatus Carsonella ruddii]AFP84283.1 hypothetical protein A357_064 [Candidatus Carsonella ruddii PC isolate NHV]